MTHGSWLLHGRPKGGSYDGVALSLPLNEAYSSLLQSWIPFLVRLTEGSCSFLMAFDETTADGKTHETTAAGGAAGGAAGRAAGGAAGGAGKRGKKGGRMVKKGTMKRLASFSEDEDTNPTLGLPSISNRGRKGRLLAPKIGAKLVRTLLSGVDEELKVLVDLTMKKNNHQQVMMLRV